MSQSIDTKIVELKFNNDNFADKVDSTLTKLQNLNKAIDQDGLGNALKNLGKQAKQVDMKGVTTGIEEAKKSFSKLEIAGITALANISNSVVNLGKRLMSKLVSPLTQGIMQGGLSRARNIERATFQFEGLKIDKSDPTLSYYKEVMDAVLGTSYSYDVAAKAASQLAASNIGVKESSKKLADGTTITSKVMTGDMTKALLGMAGVASMTGSDFDSISQIFTRVAGQGKVMAMDLNSIASRGLNAAAVLADSLHKTEAEVREMVSKGKISFDDFSKAMSDAYGAHAKDSTLMFQGALDDVNAALARIGADFYGPALKAGRDILNSITPVVDAVHNKLAPVLSKSGSFMDSASKSLSQYLDMLAYLIERFPKGKEAMNDWITEHMNAWTNIADLYGRGDFKKAVNGLSDFMSKVDGMEGKGIDGWQMLADYLHITKDEAIALGDKGAIGFNTFYKAFRQLWSQSDKLTNIAGITTEFDDYVRSVIKAQDPTEKFNRHVEVFFSLIKGGQSLFQSAKTMFGGLVDIFVTLAKHLAPLGKMFLDFAASSAQFVVNVADFMATSESFNTLIDGVVSLINKIFSFVNVSKIAAAVLAGITKAFDFVANAIEKVDAGLKKVFQAIHNVLDRIIDKIHDVVTDTEILKSIFEDLKHAGLIVAIINLIGAISQPMKMLRALGDAFTNVGDSVSGMFNQIGKVFKSISGMVGKIGAAIDEVTNTLKRMQELIVATAILEIAAAIAVLAGALYLLSKVKVDNAADALKPLLGLAASVGALFSFMAALKKYSKDIKDIDKIGKAFLEFAVAIAIISAAIYALSKIDTKSLMKATAAVEVLMLTMAAIAKLLAGKTTKDTGLKALWSGKKTSTGSITKGLTGLIAMAEAINIISKALTNIATIQDPKQIGYALGAIETLLWSLFGITKLLSGKEASKMTKGATMLLAMGVAIRLLTKPVMEFASLDSDAMMQGVLGVGFLVGALGSLVKLVSGAEGIIKAAAGILIVAIAIKKLQDVVLAFAKVDGESLVKGLGSAIGLIFGLGLALNFTDSEGLIAKAAGFVILAYALKTLSDVLLTLGGDNYDKSFQGLTVIIGLLGTLWGAVKLFEKAPTGGILKLFGTLALGALTVVAFGAAIGVFGVGLGIFGVGLENLASGVAAASAVTGPLVAIMVAFAIAIGILSSVGLPAIGVLLALSLAFLMLGGGMALMGSGLDAVAGSIKLLTELKGELAGTAKDIAEFVSKLSKLQEQSSKIGEGFSSISTPLEKIKTIAEEVTKSIQTLSDKYSELLSQTANSMQTLSTALTTITSLNADSMTKAAELIGGFIDSLKNMANDSAIIGETGKVITDAINSMQESLQGVIDTLSVFAHGSVTQFNALGESLNSITTPLQVLDNMDSKLEGLSADLISFVQSLTAMKDNAAVVEEGASAITSSLSEVSNAAGLMKAAFKDLTEATSTVLTNIGSGLKSIVEGAEGMVSVKDSLNGATKAFSKFFKKLESLSGSAAAIAQGTNTIASAVASLGSAAGRASKMASKGMTNSGKEMVVAMAKGINDNKKKVGTAVTDVIAYAVKQANGKKDSLRPVGSALIAGMISGINSQMRALAAAVQKLEEYAERAVKAKAKIKSPSRVWMKIGAYMGEGLALGISGSANTVADAAVGLASVSEDAVSAAIRTINDSVDSEWSTGPVITPIVDLSNVQKSASYIDQMFSVDPFSLNSFRGTELARSINKKNQNGGNSLESSLDSLTNQLGEMTDTMNSRQMINNIQIEGSTDPSAFADALTQRFKLKARTM